jgi:NDP-sugar pyrophosphorylase family protein
MAPIAGRPFLAWVIDDLQRQGIARVTICTGFMAEAIEEYFCAGRDWGLEIACSREDRPLGTGGAIKLALARLPSSPVLVLNGDSFCDYNASRLQAVHNARNAVATLWLVPVEDSQRYGEVALGPEDAITGFREKASGGGRGLINAGAYLLDPRLFDPLPAGTPFSLERDVFPGLAGRGLFGVRGAGPFIDIGTPESYRMADMFVQRMRS